MAPGEDGRRADGRQRPLRGGRPSFARWIACACWLFAVELAAQAPTCRSDHFLLQAEASERDGSYLNALVQLDSAMVHARLEQDRDLVGRVLLRKATIEQMLGENNAALRDLYAALALRESMQDMIGIAEVNNSIGSIHQAQHDLDKAETYYLKSKEIYERLGLRRELGKCWNNFGSLYEDQGQPSRAIELHQRSLAIWQDLDEPVWMAISFMHLASCYEQLGRPDHARTFLEKSVKLLAGDPNRYLRSTVYIQLGNSYRGSGRYAEALDLCRKGLELADSLHSVPFQQRGCECLYSAYEELGDKSRALSFYKRFIALRDSVFGQENVKEMTRLELGHAFAQRQFADSLARVEVDLRKEIAYREGLAREREQRNIFMSLGIGVVALAVGLWNRLRFVRRSRAVIQRERDRSDALLLNILPQEVAAELKEHGRAAARDIDHVSILFTDFKGFTSMSERLTAHELVAEINTCFMEFDAIAAKHGVEKIKTIGDAYMAAGGLPHPSATSARDTVLAALEMQAFMARYKADRDAEGKPSFEMRAGIHTGSVVAGIVGVRKFAYDIWGDTVNIASRMESSGAVGQVNISESTYALLKDDPHLVFEPRGRVAAKGKGDLEMYFVRKA